MPDNPSWSSSAWILSLGGELRAAVGEREMVHLVELPCLLDVPQSPLYCQQALVWNQTIIPVMNLATWLEGHPGQRNQNLAGIFAYQEQPGAAPQYGALLLSSIPIRTPVNDDQACELPEQPPGWRTIAISCFADGDDAAIPILDLAGIFSDALLRA